MQALLQRQWSLAAAVRKLGCLGEVPAAGEAKKKWWGLGVGKVARRTTEAGPSGQGHVWPGRHQAWAVSEPGAKGQALRAE